MVVVFLFVYTVVVSVFDVIPVALAIACSKSSIKSSTCSMPTDKRIKSSVTPEALRPSSLTAGALYSPGE